MAEVWIKWVKGLVKRREVVVLARKLNLSCREAAAACMELWEWADGETTNGHIQGATREDIDLMLNIPGFAAAFESPEVGWVKFTDRGLTLSRWERNHGESAKKRALEQRKKKRQRELEENGVSRKRPRKRPGAIPKLKGPERNEDGELNSSSTSNQGSIPVGPLPPEWAATAAGLWEEGVRKADDACRAAIANGCSPEDVLAVLCHYRGKPGCWDAQDLYYRVIDMKPGDDFTQRWRPEKKAPTETVYVEVSAEQFREYGLMRKFRGKPARHVTKPSWVFGILRDGTKVECRDYPLPRKEGDC